MRPSPRQHRGTAEPEQRLYCARRGECIDLAIAERWTAFHCVGCPVTETLSHDQLACDMPGLLELVGAVLDGGRLRQRQSQEKSA